MIYTIKNEVLYLKLFNRYYNSQSRTWEDSLIPTYVNVKHIKQFSQCTASKGTFIRIDDVALGADSSQRYSINIDDLLTSLGLE
jgi:hypothetical protein